MVETSVRFGRVKFSIRVAAGVDRGEIDRFANEAIERAADRARSENRTLRPLEVLQALRRAMTSRWVSATVNMES